MAVWLHSLDVDSLPLLLSVPEFAQLARKGRNWGYEQVQTGQVRAIRLGRTIRIPRSEALRALGLDQGEAAAS